MVMHENDILLHYGLSVIDKGNTIKIMPDG